MRSAGKYGRRKSDWYIPIGMALIIGLAMGWALDNRAKSEEIARLSGSLQSALELSAAKAPPEIVPPESKPGSFPPQAPAPQAPARPEAGPRPTPAAVISPVPGRSPQAP